MAAAWEWHMERMHAGGSTMTEIVKEQILTIRETGITNYGE